MDDGYEIACTGVLATFELVDGQATTINIWLSTGSNHNRSGRVRRSFHPEVVGLPKMQAHSAKRLKASAWQ